MYGEAWRWSGLDAGFCCHCAEVYAGPEGRHLHPWKAYLQPKTDMRSKAVSRCELLVSVNLASYVCYLGTFFPLSYGNCSSSFPASASHYTLLLSSPFSVVHIYLLHLIFGSTSFFLLYHLLLHHYCSVCISFKPRSSFCSNVRSYSSTSILGSLSGA